MYNDIIIISLLHFLERKIFIQKIHFNTNIMRFLPMMFINMRLFMKNLLSFHFKQHKNKLDVKRGGKNFGLVEETHLKNSSF
jgi:hypothetical protein